MKIFNWSLSFLHHDLFLDFFIQTFRSLNLEVLPRMRIALFLYQLQFVNQLYRLHLTHWFVVNDVLNLFSFSWFHHRTCLSRVWIRRNWDRLLQSSCLNIETSLFYDLWCSECLLCGFAVNRRCSYLGQMLIFNLLKLSLRASCYFDRLSPWRCLER